MRSIGGIPVDRNASHGVVERGGGCHQTADQMVFALSPEGTRQLDKGFQVRLPAYRARRGRYSMTYFDFEHKAIGFGPLMRTTGDADAVSLTARHRVFPAHSGKHIRKCRQENTGGTRRSLNATQS